ncbi:hypothetical protein [Mucilaginibacter ginkgonis]|uniref:Uncharacterized protein n=1 Tax=Mucilaginibacter ginkgonis TaxID=2682091 RepID=A0A7T7JHR6_9SPHI|nr:hypothetical protein [Mucilaginibacter ginkgonis]QQL50815.1 hypothetical protein GO620_004980 [Mucilaginibacter ginkgonis]
MCKPLKLSLLLQEQIGQMQPTATPFSFAPTINDLLSIAQILNVDVVQILQQARTS